MIKLTESIIAYEDGQLDEDQVTELFKQLVETGLLWSLQGHYQREAHARGLI